MDYNITYTFHIKVVFLSIVGECTGKVIFTTSTINLGRETLLAKG